MCGPVSWRQTWLRGTSSLPSSENRLAMLARGQLCGYNSVRVLRIHSVWIGTLKNVFLVGTCIYICFALVSDKLYQRKEPVISSVHTKVKGIAEVKEEVVEDGMKRLVQRVLDTADYTFPLQGNSFFVMTNFLKTEGQEQRLCPEYPTRRTLCSSDRGCKKGWMDPQSKGIQTGRCVVYKGDQKTCEVAAWCPIEAVEEAPRPARLSSAENFTVLIKNNVDFPGHNYTTRNILPGLNITCTFHKTQNPQCPIFRLGDIFQETGDNFSDVAIQGGIMGIEIYWDCNLDSWSHHCRPKYSFRRLDDKTTNESLYPGYNFRYAKYYKENNVEKRTLIKVFGIRFDILVFGTGGKFDIIQLVVYVGSTLSYFGLVRASLSHTLRKWFGRKKFHCHGACLVPARPLCSLTFSSTRTRALSADPGCTPAARAASRVPSTSTTTARSASPSWSQSR
uniref:P2X purinoceptor n=1 Tax=Sciurus vulgaris TaxID=55149 RepID=A0A8D2B3U8_SCIVU